MYTQIHQNGIQPFHSRYETEKIVAFNWQIFICIIVSFLFIFLSLCCDFYQLTAFSFSYLILFSASFFCIYKNQHNCARNIYLFTSNYSVFTISFCFGYEAGFYFYFFTTPLTVFISYDHSKRIHIYLALLTYLVNAFVMNYLYHSGILVNPGVLTETEITILFNLNLFTSFFMVFMFMTSISRINRFKTREAEVLYQKQSMLKAQIHQKQLDETKVQFQYKKLESEYQQLDMFSHIISHNLRGPISRVSGILQLLKPYSSASGDQQQLMEHLNSSVLMIDEVIKDLNYILVQKKLGQESSSNISLREILQEVKLHLSEEIKNSNAIIRENFFEEKIPCVKGIMISIFYNLISNSIKYSMPGQQPVLDIVAEKNEHQLTLTFKDEGVGFDADKYGDKLFRLYNRFHSHVAGKGMGLFLVKSHVDMLDGLILVESAPRKGTTFTIYLPLKENTLPSNIFNTTDKAYEERML
ncbi:MAG: HAMP domain-containing histidine kinase [Cytophagaceae bacterium]|nr:HAMP domain-containing histidine kinase [Cytophagaceae bacterium]